MLLEVIFPSFTVMMVPVGNGKEDFRPPLDVVFAAPSFNKKNTTLCQKVGPGLTNHLGELWCPIGGHQFRQVT